MDLKKHGFHIFAACAIAALVVIALVNFFQAKSSGIGARTISYTEFLDEVDHGQVRSVVMAGQRIVGSRTDRTPFKTFAANDAGLLPLLRQKGVVITAGPSPAEAPALLPSLLTTLVPTLLLVGFALFFMNRMTPGGGRANSLTKSRARRMAETSERVTFADVAGVDEARDSMAEIVEFLRNPQKFQSLGGRIPRGVLLVGPPGSGKTLLARAIAGEASVPFFTISGSDFVEMFVGVGAARVRDMFNAAKKSAPCIIFVDEIDAVGRRRGAGLGGGNDEREQTLNQLLVEMDGFSANSGVIMIAATNRPDVLDPALLRPGRFDREIVVSNPDVHGREAILRVHARRAPLAADVDLAVVARATPGFSGAELMNLVNEAALLAARRGKTEISRREFEEARDTVTMGVERRTHLMSAEERRLTAVREGGRAIVALLVPAADPVHKATIIPRGRSNGAVKQIAETDRIAETREQLTSRLTIHVSGRVAEEIVFGPAKVTSGSAGDIEQATDLARKMVTRWGLSDQLGLVAYGEDKDEVFLGHSVTRQHNVSEETAQLIAIEIRKLIDSAVAEARRILTANRAKLDAIAQALLDQETLSGEEIEALLAGKPAARQPAAPPVDAPTPARVKP